nr:TldD/PmbA family protein [Candidatus Sigynarchaeota archaeon]
MSARDDGFDEISIKHRIEKEIASHGIKHYEVFLSTGTEISIDVERGSLKNAELIRDVGFGIRVAGQNGQSAFSYTSKMDGESIRKVIRNAVSAMNKATADADFHSFGENSKITKLPARTLFDPAIESLEIDNAVGLVTRTLESARSVGDPRVYSINASLKGGTSHVLVFNSNGVDVSEDHTDIALDCDVIVKEGEEMSSDFDFDSGRELAQVSPDVGARAAALALKTLGKVRLKTGYHPTVLSPRAAGGVIGSLIARATNAESVQQGMSFLGDKIGKRVGPTHLTIVDDPRLDTGSRQMTCSFDAEGFSTSRKDIIKDGVLQTLLHNSYTANKAGVKSTGNAVRSGYNTPPHISNFNLLVAPDKSRCVPEEDLFSGIKYGVYFDETYDSPNMATGDFSGMMTSGFLIENGAIGAPIQQANFGMNLLQALETIELYGDKPEDRAGIIAPAVRLKGLQLSGNL